MSAGGGLVHIHDFFLRTELFEVSHCAKTAYGEFTASAIMQFMQFMQPGPG